MWGFIKRCVVVAFASGLVISTAIAANWDGEGGSSPAGTTYFDWGGRQNFYGNVDPTWNSSTPLYFNFNNGGHSIMVQNIGYKSVQSIIYESTFTGDTTINGSDGFDLYWKVENNDTGSHTINVPLVIQGTLFELNPINGNLTIGGSINNFNNRTLQVYGNNGFTLTLNTAVNGTGGLTVEQNSIVLLNTAQGYSGDTILNAGEVRLGASDRINDASDLDINALGTFNLNNFNETVATMDNDGTLTLGTGQLIVNGGGGTWDGTMSASSGGSLVKKGGGTVSITGDNTGMASGSSLYLVGGITGLNNNNAAGSATIYLGETSGTDAATLDSSTSDVSLGNNIVVRDGSSGVKTIDNATASGSRSITFTGNVTLDDTVYVDASTSESITFGGAISSDADGDAEGIVKRGFGNMVVGASSTFAGGLYIDEGTVTIGSGGDITAASTIDIGSELHNSGSGNAELALASGASAIDRNITVQDGTGSRTISSAGNNTLSGTVNQEADLSVSSSSGTLTMSGNVNMNSSGERDLNISGAGNVSISGSINSSSGASEINKSGTGTLSLSGDNSGELFAVNIAGGTVAINAANALGAGYSDKVDFTSSGTLDVNANVGPASLGLRAGSGATATIDVNGGNTFTVATLANIAGSGTFTKTGGGTLELTGSSTYSGTFNQNQGITDVGGASLTASSFNLNAGTLQGAGTVGGTFVQTSGVLSPGNSPGTLNIVGNTTWNGGSYLWEINDVDAGAGTDPGWDLVNITGSLTVNSYQIDVTSLTLANAAGTVNDFNAATDYTWTIATASGGVTVNNAPTINLAGFQNVHNGAGAWSITSDANNLFLNYDGDFVAPVSAVPEPNALSYAMLAGLLAWSLRYRMFKARQAAARAEC